MIGGLPVPPPIKLLQLPKKMPTTASRKEAEHRASPELPISTGHLPTVSSHLDLVGMEERFFSEHSGRLSEKLIDEFMVFLKFKRQGCVIHIKNFCTPKPSKTEIICHFHLLFEESTVKLPAVKSVFLQNL